MKKRKFKLIATLGLTVVMSTGLFYAFADEPEVCTNIYNCSHETFCDAGHKGLWKMGEGWYCCELFPAIPTGHLCFTLPAE